MPARPWDVYVVLADRYGWTPDQVARLDPEFVEELLALLTAQNEQRRRQEQQR